MAPHPDLVERNLTATVPRPLVAGLHVRVDLGRVAYVCFLVDDAYSRMIVGWRPAGIMRTAMVLAIEMARRYEEKPCRA